MIVMLNRVLDTIRKYELIKPGETVIAGVSGGPDSVCLLHVLCSISAGMGIKLHAVHINHLLRGGESDEDEEYVKQLCLKSDVPLHVKRVDISAAAQNKGMSLEEAGREARYEYFEQVAAKVGADRIAVAHNRNDQAETVLMHFIRGSGLNGLTGMDFKRGKIIRPLLGIDRTEIEEYCRIHSLNPRTDSTNLKTVYTRNKVRLDLIPAIDRLFNADITDSACRMAILLKDDDAYIEESALKLYRASSIHKSGGEVQLELSKVQDCHPAIIRRVIRRAIHDLKKDLKGIGSVHIEDAAKLISGGRTGQELHLPSGVRVYRSYERIVFRMDDKERERLVYEQPVCIPGVTEVDALGFRIEASFEDDKSVEDCVNIGYNSLVQFFDYDKFNSGINIRNRRDGDVFRPLKSNGTKKLKKYFIDMKIPRDERDRIPLAATGSEIVWVVGCKISDKFKVTDNTKRVLKLAVVYNSNKSNKRMTASGR